MARQTAPRERQAEKPRIRPSSMIDLAGESIRWKRVEDTELQPNFHFPGKVGLGPSRCAERERYLVFVSPDSWVEPTEGKSNALRSFDHNLLGQSKHPGGSRKEISMELESEIRAKTIALAGMPANGC
jgi:hypothetical protein